MTDRSEWLNQRRMGITGTDVAKILGVSKWGTALEVYKDKLGLTPEKPMNAAMQFGVDQEPLIIKEYSKKNNAKVIQVGHLVHSKESWIIGNPDGIVADDTNQWIKGLEIKTGSQKKYWGVSGDPEVRIPVEYQWQCRWYMALTNLQEWDIAVLLEKTEYRQYTLNRDLKIEQAMLDQCRNFWENFVMKKIEPSP